MSSSALGVAFDYTYNGKLGTDVMFKPTVGTPALSDFFTIRQAFKYKEQIALMPSLSKIVKAYSACTRTFTDGIDMTNTTLTLAPLEVNMQWCKDDFESLAVGNVMSEQYLKDGIEEFDPSGTQIQRWIDELINDGMRRDTFRIFSFGDTNDADANWNQLDGLWTQLIANAGSGSAYCVNRVHDFSDTLAAGEALVALKAAYENSAIILKQIEVNNKYFAVTGSVYENLMSSYESNTTGSEKMFLNLTDGQNGPSLMYRGINVIPVYAWDLALDDPTCPLYPNTNHLLLYTTKDNHAAGFARQSDSEKIAGWYDRDSRLYKIEGFYRMGYSYFHCDLQSIAN